jgi:hypothetical protein
MSLTQITSINQSSTDLELGEFAITSFWAAARSINPDFPQDFDAYTELLRRSYYPKSSDEAPAGYTNFKQTYFPNSSQAALETFVDGLGLGIRSVDIELAPERITSSMQQLAQAGGGGIPASEKSFFSAIQEQAESYSFFDMTSFVAMESAKDIVTGVQKVGEAVIDTGASILKYRNYILIAAVIAGGYYLYTVYGKTLFKANPVRKTKKHIWKDPSKIQSLLFLKAAFTEDDAIDWARRHGFSYAKVDKGGKYWRMRQASPTFFDDFRTIELGDKTGIKAIIGPVKKQRFPF